MNNTSMGYSYSLYTLEVKWYKLLTLIIFTQYDGVIEENDKFEYLKKKLVFVLVKT